MASAGLGILVLAVLVVACRALEGDVVWYIDASSSADLDTCGHSPDQPCPSLEVVFAQSVLINESSSCFESLGDDDGRNSTTVHIRGSMFVPAICVSNWYNVTIVGYPAGSKAVISTHYPGSNSVFSFTNCTNIWLEGLTFNTSSQGRQNLYFERCSDVSLIGCSMPLTATYGYGVEFRNCGGKILVERSQFYGDVATSGNENRGIALRIVTGNGLDLSPGTFPAVRAVVRRCVFSDMKSLGAPQNSYRQALSSALSMLVQLQRGAHDTYLLVEDCDFRNVTNSVGHSVTVHFDAGSKDNRVVFSGCRFTSNSVRYGGGVATYFSGSDGSINGSLEISNCTFTDNIAHFEGGGVFVAFLQEEIANQVAIRGCHFQGNQALYGAGIFLFNQPAWYSQAGPPNAVELPLTPTIIENCVFMENNASLSEGIINALRIILSMANVTFSSNNGSALLLRLSLGYLEDELLFENNTARKGGAIGVFDRSRIDLVRVKKAVFKGNRAVVSGGAIFADKSSTSFTANEYNHSLAENRFGFCFATFGNEARPIFAPSNNPGQVVFEDNFAYGDGMTLSAYSLRGCRVANFVPEGIASFLRLPTDDSIVFSGTDELGVTSTGPSYLFFYGASSRCYKPVGNITYLLPNCSHSLLMSTFYTLPGLECGLKAQLEDLRTSFGPSAALMPTLDKLITPWAGLETTWTANIGSRGARCLAAGKEAVPGGLYLSPAPGEEFDLTVQLGDQLLNYVSSTVYMEVEHTSSTVPPGVLIQLNEIQYSFNDRVFFTPNRAVSGLTLVGLPGTEGNLRVVAESQVIGQDIVLLIPFKLAQCPLGYYSPPGANSIEEVNQLLMTRFQYTQRIPDDQPLACSCLNDTRRHSSRQDLNDRTLDLPHACIRGYTVQLNSIVWAGLVRSSRPSPLPPPIYTSCPSSLPGTAPVYDSLTEFIRQARANESASTLTSDPVDVVVYEEGVQPGGGAPITCYQGNNISALVQYKPAGEFTTEYCTRGYCRGDIRTAWVLSDVDHPCILTREGLLCGKCREGYALTSYYTTCSDCRNPLPAIPLLLTIVLGLGMVVAVVAFNFEASPTVDSLLFFTQTLYIMLSGRNNYEAFHSLAFFNPDFTFNLCITPDLNALGRLGLQFMTPLYILTLLFIVLLLTRLKVFSKLLGRHSFVKSLWFLVLISYINIVNTTFNLLHCRTVASGDGGEKVVLEHDASITCYEGTHLPLAILAIIATAVFILPFPVYLIVLLYLPRFKPFTDVYTQIYRDDRQLWVAWSLGRRLFLVLIGIFVTDPILRHFSLLLGLVAVMVVVVITWPYKSSTDNNFAFLVSWVLVIVAVFTAPELYLLVDTGHGPSGTLVLTVLLLGFTLVVVERVAWKRKTTVDAVAAKALARCKVWKSKVAEWVAARLPCTTSEENVTRKGVSTATSNLPRYRETLLGDENSFSDNIARTRRETLLGDANSSGNITRTRSRERTKCFKGWKKHLRFKTEEYEVPLCPSVVSPITSGMYTSTVIGMEEEGRYSDSGLAFSATDTTTTQPSTSEQVETL